MSVASTTKKRRRSSKKNSRSGSILESLREISNQEMKDTMMSTKSSSTMTETSTVKINIDYEEEMISFFYNSTLSLLVETWEVVKDQNESDVSNLSAQKPVEKVESKDFKDLSERDLEESQMVAVQGSQVSLAKKRKNAKRKSSGSSQKDSKGKRDSKSRRKSSIERKSKRSSSEVKQMKMSDLKTVATETDAFVQMEKIEEEFRSVSEVMEPCKSNLSDNLSSTSYEFCQIKFTNGNVYKGPVFKKKMHGVGSYFWTDGTFYKGEFNNGDITGKGFLVLPDLSYYIGNFCKGYFHGYGSFYIANTNSLYSGYWYAGQKQGKGWILYNQGNWYDGDWFEDHRHGEGLRQYDYGIRYKGSWENGNRHGFGTMLFANNDLYKGEWVEGKPEGNGSYTWNVVLVRDFILPSLAHYDGNWKDGMRNGSGILTIGGKIETFLVGHWENNLKHGPFIIILGSGKIIQKNPLFYLDKLVNAGEKILECGIVSSENNISSTAECYSVISNKNMQQAVHKLIKSFLSETESHTSDKYSLSTRQSIMKKFFKFIDKEVIAVDDVIDFPNPIPVCDPMEINIHVGAVECDLRYFIAKVLSQCKAQCNNLEDNDRRKSEIKFGPQTVCIKCSKTFCKYEQTHKIQEGFFEFEQLKLRNLFQNYHSKILQVYSSYCFLRQQNEEYSYTPTMVRMGLWQMYIDIGMTDMGFSLIDLDNLHYRNLESAIENPHDPFEEILLWQFWQILIALSWHACVKMPSFKSVYGVGVLASITKKFLLSIVLPNIHSRKSKCLFEYRHLLPIKSLYKLYKSYGEPHSALTFFKNTCVRKGKEIPCYFKSYPDEDNIAIKKGVNVFIGKELYFLTDDPPLIRDRDYEQEIPTDPFYKTLYIFRTLRPKKILECIISACPLIQKEGIIVNMQYEITFLEFYEILINCALAMIEKEERLEEKMKRRAEIDKLKAEGVWFPKKVVGKVKSSKTEKASKKNKDKTKAK